MNIYGSDGTLWLAASCKLQQYDSEGCKICARLFVSFMVVVVDALMQKSRDGDSSTVSTEGLILPLLATRPHTMFTRAAVSLLVDQIPVTQ